MDDAAASGDNGQVGIELPCCCQPAGANAGLLQVCPQLIPGHGVKGLLEIDKAGPQLRVACGTVAVLQRAQHKVCLRRAGPRQLLNSAAANAAFPWLLRSARVLSLAMHP